MDDGPTTLQVVTLIVAGYGAGLSTWLALAKRRRKLLATSGFTTGRLGSARNHLFFGVRIINTGQRALTISSIWWIGEAASAELHVFRTNRSEDLPVKVEPDEELQVLVDFESAARTITQMEVTAIEVHVAGRKRPWRVELDNQLRAEAAEEWAQAQEESSPS